MNHVEVEKIVKQQYGEYLFNKYDIADLLTGKYEEYENNNVKCPYVTNTNNYIQ